MVFEGAIDLLLFLAKVGSVTTYLVYLVNQLVKS